MSSGPVTTTGNGCWALYGHDGARWRMVRTPTLGLDFLAACALANWYRSLYGGDWCAAGLA